MPQPKPKLPTPSQLFADAEKLLKMVVPLIEDAYEFSQIVGEILKEANKGNGQPPATYYIGEDPSDPSDPSQPAQPMPGTGIPIASFGDKAGGLQLYGTSYKIYVGQSQDPLVTVAGTYAGGAPVVNGIPTVGAGPGQMPIAAEGVSAATGPIMDMYPDGVYVGTPNAYNAAQKHWLYTVSGTFIAPSDQGATPPVPGDIPSIVANDPSVLDYFNWYAVQYPAQAFPMGPSVDTGVKNLVASISMHGGTFAMSGYSQGAMVTCRVWRDEILNPNGQLHDRMDDFIAHVTWGNPMRSPGYANGNGLANIPMPSPVDGYLTGGIAGSDDLTPWQTMPQHIDFVHEGDLYADCPTGPDPWTNEAPPGLMETAIYNLVQGTITGPEGLLEVIGDVLTNPIGELVPLFEALINGIQFLAGGSSAPHYTYQVDCQDPAIKYLANRGPQVPARTS